MPADPDITATLARHAARRRAGIATVTVFVGAIGPARRAWSVHAPTIFESLGDPHACLSAWANKNRTELRQAALAHLADRKGHDPQTFANAWNSKTRADIALFWEALPPYLGDDHLRSLLDPSASFPSNSTLPTLLLHEALNAVRPALFAVVTDPASLAHWATFAEHHPAFAVAVAVEEALWWKFTINPVLTRIEAILREGETRVPMLSVEEVVSRLVAAGLPQMAAEVLGQTGCDESFVNETVVQLKATVNKTTTKKADDDARSNAERYIYARLQDLAETKGKFEQNSDKLYDSGTSQEIDLICQDPKIAIEVDGYFHFRSDEDYRHDREKDWELQRHGYLVLRFLAEDVTRHWDVVRDRIFAALKRNAE